MKRSDSARLKNKADEGARLKTKTELLADLKSDDYRSSRIRRRISQVEPTRHGRRTLLLRKHSLRNWRTTYYSKHATRPEPNYYWVLERDRPPRLSTNPTTSHYRTRSSIEPMRKPVEPIPMTSRRQRSFRPDNNGTYLDTPFSQLVDIRSVENFESLFHMF